jgi:hypothetical protein
MLRLWRAWYFLIIQGKVYFLLAAPFVYYHQWFYSCHAMLFPRSRWLRQRRASVVEIESANWQRRLTSLTRSPH